ncbi:hypothetical protein L486_00587 [Kwoniella mangroviensis CBS 10435]|uniref:Short-chain dehydrogenase n=1 Tax=Kwoniella mangroviensis CBS 10435 TaxID=1331196 RepID=A0A1B9IZK3_9TREE|nr:hypothetical protein L486_00587 [Kwoniella mangroviensis CBS 10435]OCF74307.1 hypothetical protein I204_04678 [Kwoniella mangroviensis CBS 8886]
MSSEKTIVFITGANTGIGYQTVRYLLSSHLPYLVFLGTRSEEKSKTAIEKLLEECPNTRSTLAPALIDLESDESIEKAVKAVRSVTDKIDVLIHNAGVEFYANGLTQGLTTREIFDKTYTTNIAGPHILTTLLIPLLLRSDNPRLLFLTSGTASFELGTNPEFILNKSPAAGWPKPPQRELFSYKSSKVALNMIMRDWYRILKEDKVKVWTVNPGLVVTGLGGDTEILKELGAGNPAGSGQFVVNVIEGERDEDVGKTVQRQWLYGEILPF